MPDLNEDEELDEATIEFETELLETCPDCGRLQCICETGDDEEARYLDKRLSDREDFHSDDARFPSCDDEPYFPDY